jgi:ubiquinone/menaquinone biosynthesis C-methylase UbiE
MNYHAEGLDFSREIIDALKAAAPSIPWHHGDIRAMPFPDNTFSLLLCWGVVEHFEAGPEPALRELYRVLAPGGTCFVSVPYLNQWRQRTFKGTTNRAPGRTVFNQNYFRADEFLGCLRRVGFTNSRLIPIAKHIEVVLPMLERLKPKLLKRVMNRLLVPLVPAEVGSHMLLAITQKNGSATELAPPKHEVPRSASAGL